MIIAEELLAILVTAIITRYFSTWVDSKKTEKLEKAIEAQRAKDMKTLKEERKGDLDEFREEFKRTQDAQEKFNGLFFKKLDVLVDTMQRLTDSLKEYVLKEDHKESVLGLGRRIDKVEERAELCGKCANYKKLGV